MTYAIETLKRVIKRTRHAISKRLTKTNLAIGGLATAWGVTTNLYILFLEGTGTRLEEIVATVLGMVAFTALVVIVLGFAVIKYEAHIGSVIYFWLRPIVNLLLRRSS